MHDIILSSVNDDTSPCLQMKSCLLILPECLALYIARAGELRLVSQCLLKVRPWGENWSFPPLLGARLSRLYVDGSFPTPIREGPDLGWLGAVPHCYAPVWYSYLLIISDTVKIIIIILLLFFITIITIIIIAVVVVMIIVITIIIIITIMTTRSLSSPSS